MVTDAHNDSQPVELRDRERERERRVSVYEEAPGFRPGPRPVELRKWSSFLGSVRRPAGSSVYATMPFMLPQPRVSYRVN